MDEPRWYTEKPGWYRIFSPPNGHVPEWWILYGLYRGEREAFARA